MMIVFIATLIILVLAALYLKIYYGARSAAVFFIIAGPVICLMALSWNTVIKQRIPYSQKLSKAVMALGWIPGDYYQDIFSMRMDLKKAGGEYGADVIHPYEGIYWVGFRFPVASKNIRPKPFQGKIELMFYTGGEDEKEAFKIENNRGKPLSTSIDCTITKECTYTEYLMTYKVPKEVFANKPVFLRIRPRVADVEMFRQYKPILFSALKKSK